MGAAESRKPNLESPVSFRDTVHQLQKRSVSIAHHIRSNAPDERRIAEVPSGGGGFHCVFICIWQFAKARP